MIFSSTNPDLNELIPDSKESNGIISIWGDIGVGKTTLCLNAALGKLVSGKKVIYINTRPEFKIKRFEQIKSAYRSFNPHNMILYCPKSYKKLFKIIMDMEFLLLEEKRIFNENKIALIIIDTATTLLHLEMKGDAFNQKMQIQLNALLASLDHLIKEYGVSVIISNRAISKFDEKQDKMIVNPASERSINYWSKFSLKIERLNEPGGRVLFLEKSPDNKMKKIRCKLIDSGFD